MKYCPICNDVFHKKDLEKHIMSHKHDDFVMEQLIGFDEKILTMFKIDIVPIAIKLIKRNNKFKIDNDYITIYGKNIIKLSKSDSIRLIQTMAEYEEPDDDFEYYYYND